MKANSKLLLEKKCAELHKAELVEEGDPVLPKEYPHGVSAPTWKKIPQAGKNKEEQSDKARVSVEWGSPLSSALCWDRQLE